MTEAPPAAAAKKVRKAPLPPHPCSGADPSTFTALPFLPQASMAAFVAGLPPRGGGGGVKVLCYNVNGLRGATREGERREEMLAWLAAEDPDVLCIQEVKADRAAVEKEKLAGVFPSLPHAYFACGEEDGARFKKGYAGVAVFSKEPAVSCTVGLGSKAHDGEGRVLTLAFPWGTLVNVYAPNSGQALDRLGYRTEEFDPALRAHLGKLLKAEGGGGSSSSSGGGGGAAPPVLVVGDFNVAHQNCDVMGFKEYRNKIAGFCDGERDNFAALLAEGYRDLWRDANPTTLQYSECWAAQVVPQGIFTSSPSSSHTVIHTLHTRTPLPPRAKQPTTALGAPLPAPKTRAGALTMPWPLQASRVQRSRSTAPGPTTTTFPFTLRLKSEGYIQG